MEREVGGGIGMGNTCKPMADSFQCMTKSTTNKKIHKIVLINIPNDIRASDLTVIYYSIYSNSYFECLLRHELSRK